MRYKILANDDGQFRAVVNALQRTAADVRLLLRDLLVVSVENPTLQTRQAVEATGARLTQDQQVEREVPEKIEDLPHLHR